MSNDPLKEAGSIFIHGSMFFAGFEPETPGASEVVIGALKTMISHDPHLRDEFSIDTIRSEYNVEIDVPNTGEEGTNGLMVSYILSRVEVR